MNEKLTENILYGKKILIAEDNELSSEIVISILEMQGVEKVVWVRDGDAVVREYTEHPEGYFHAIIMDIQMPYADGFQAAAQVRKCNRADSGTIPIIALTASTFKDDKKKAKEAGMNGYICKPFEASQIIQVLKNELYIPGE